MHHTQARRVGLEHYSASLLDLGSSTPRVGTQCCFGSLNIKRVKKNKEWGR
jgi:hypothetical protein